MLTLWCTKIQLHHIAKILGKRLNVVSNILKILYKEKLYFKYLKNRNEFLGGGKMVVEVDESKFGKRKYSNGHGVKCVWILGMV